MELLNDAGTLENTSVVSQQVEWNYHLTQKLHCYITKKSWLYVHSEIIYNSKKYISIFIEELFMVIKKTQHQCLNIIDEWWTN